MAATPAGASRDAPTCAFCGRPFAPDDDQLLVMKNGAVVAAYHESCRPDRRRKGCAGC